MERGPVRDVRLWVGHGTRLGRVVVSGGAFKF